MAHIVIAGCMLAMMWLAAMAWHVRSESGFGDAQGAQRLVVGVVVLTLYLAPTGIAVLRQHINVLPIVAINVMLGWTGLGWIAALVWSVMSTDRSRKFSR